MRSPSARSADLAYRPDLDGGAYGRRMAVDAEGIGPRRVWPWFIGFGLAGLAAITAATVIAVHALTGPAVVKPTARPTFIARGVLELDGSHLSLDDGSCFGTGGFADIRGGAALVIYDAGGKALVVGSIADGRAQGDSFAPCLFAFDVPGVPGGVGPYTVEVSSRGRVPFAEAEAGGLSLVLR